MMYYVIPVLNFNKDDEFITLNNIFTKLLFFFMLFSNLKFQMI